jgi:hypothetical protein
VLVLLVSHCLLVLYLRVVVTTWFVSKHRELILVLLEVGGAIYFLLLCWGLVFVMGGWRWFALC